MPDRPLKLISLFLLAVLFVCLQAALTFIFPAQTMVVSYPFMILAPVFAALACWRQTRIANPSAWLSWFLLTTGLFLWFLGITISAWEELFQHLYGSIAFFSDFVFFLYGAPILLAISLPAEEQRIPLFIWLDGIQAILTAYLTYIALFATAPFSTTGIQPIPETLLASVFDTENIVLACFATLRLLARPRHKEERRFFKILCAFLWVYALCAWIYNHQYLLLEHHTVFDLLASIPFLGLAVITLHFSSEKHLKEIRSPGSKSSLSLFMDNACPIFYTLALLALGVAVIRSHFYTGIFAILIALAVYGIRTTVLQSRYMRSQHALQEARDRLEEMSLKDALTNIANRRCFDQFLELEWHRAMRNQSPLSLLLIDIDHFKELNDRHGHRHGDQCLIAIAGALQSALPRSSDLLARYGGEEFVAILPATDKSGAKAVADNMQEAIRVLGIENKTSTGDYVTLSIGIAVYEFPQSGSPGSLVEASDRALYEAKQAGRNQIRLSLMHAV